MGKARKLVALLAIAGTVLVAACAGRGAIQHQESAGRLYAEHCAACHGDNARGGGPIWGYEFFGNDSDDERAHGRSSARVDGLVAFLKSRQQR